MKAGPARGQRRPRGQACAAGGPDWVLRFSEEFAADILAALAEHQRLRSQIAPSTQPRGRSPAPRHARRARPHRQPAARRARPDR